MYKNVPFLAIYENKKVRAIEYSLRCTTHNWIYTKLTELLRLNWRDWTCCPTGTKRTKKLM